MACGADSSLDPRTENRTREETAQSDLLRLGRRGEVDDAIAGRTLLDERLPTETMIELRRQGHVALIASAIRVVCAIAGPALAAQHARTGDRGWAGGASRSLPAPCRRARSRSASELRDLCRRCRLPSRRAPRLIRCRCSASSRLDRLVRTEAFALGRSARRSRLRGRERACEAPRARAGRRSISRSVRERFSFSRECSICCAIRADIDDGDRSGSSRWSASFDRRAVEEQPARPAA